MAKVTISGWRELRKQLVERFPQEIKAQVQPVLEKSGNEMVSMAKSLAPVDDGDLHDSIRMTTAGERTSLYSDKVPDLSVRVTAGTGAAWYGRIVEFGRKATAKHGGMAARPFFFPPYRALKPKFRRRINRALNKAVKRFSR